jgi:hypothetical protein
MLAVLSFSSEANWISKIGEKPLPGICAGSHLKARARKVAIARPHFLTDVFPQPARWLRT